MNASARLSLLLLIICAVSAGALALVDATTSARIQENEAFKERILRGKALAGEQQGGGIVFDPEPVSIDTRQYYTGRLDGEFVGTAFTAATNKGYSGPIEIVIAMDKTGEKVAGVRIKSHSETPGLGANATEIKYGEIEPWFLAQFEGLRPAEIRLKKDSPDGTIDAITAATITSRAITDCVREEAQAFEEEWSEMREKQDHADTD
jgi:electron transport complex protein RnfG